MPNSSLLQSACPFTISANHFLSTAAASRSMDSSTLFLSRIPACIPIACLIPAFLLAFVVTTLTFWLSPGGPAWGRFRHSLKCNIGSFPAIPGPRGWPILGSFLDMGRLAHIRLAHLARAHSATSLMAFSLGQTRVVLTCKPSVARELLNSSAFADRPIKQSAKLLLFDRAIGFAPYGEYWRNLRRIAATHLFSPRKIAALEACRQFETSELLQAISDNMSESCVQVRKFLQVASVNNIMNSVFGRRYDFGASCEEAEMLQRMVREGFELLGSFNWGDHLPALQVFDPHRVNERCNKLVEEVRVFVQKIIDEHRRKIKEETRESDFVDVMLSLQNTEKLSDSDIISVLWEMIFRGTDTTAILMEWILAELVLHPGVQARAHSELDDVVGSSRTVAEADIANLTYLQAIVKETLRLHPPGPLLSWARLAIHDVDIAGHKVPAGTTAMVNMWAITHDADVWEQPDKFMPARFLIPEGGIDLDVRGNDLRLAPFGAGRRVCPGRALGLATVQLWTARLLHHFIWVPAPNHPVDLSEVLKLSCEMKTPLSAGAIRRIPLAFH